jgi:hypothetical protein
VRDGLDNDFNGITYYPTTPVARQSPTTMSARPLGLLHG